MKNAAIVALVLACMSILVSAESVDHIVATVNRQPILQSDITDEAHFEALQQGKSPDTLISEPRVLLERIIDRELVCQQIPENFEPSAEAIDQRISEIRAQFPRIETSAQWRDLLDQYGFDEAALRQMVTVQLQVLHFLDIRLRPTVRVDTDEVSDYYEKELVPKLKAAGATVTPLDSVKQRIEEVLLQQKMDAVFNAWIANLRGQSNIRILDPSLAAPKAAAGNSTKTLN